MRLCLTVISEATYVKSYPTWLPKCELTKDVTNDHAKLDREMSKWPQHFTQKNKATEESWEWQRLSSPKKSSMPVRFLVSNGHL